MCDNHDDCLCGGIPFNLEMPALDSIYPNSILFVLIVMVVVISVVASLGYEAVIRFVNIAAPWIVLIFFANGGFGKTALP